jgi:hypothetical protein
VQVLELVGPQLIVVAIGAGSIGEESSGSSDDSDDAAAAVQLELEREMPFLIAASMAAAVHRVPVLLIGDHSVLAVPSNKQHQLLAALVALATWTIAIGGDRQQQESRASSGTIRGGWVQAAMLVRQAATTRYRVEDTVGVGEHWHRAWQW